MILVCVVAWRVSLNFPLFFISSAINNNNNNKKIWMKKYFITMTNIFASDFVMMKMQIFKKKKNEPSSMSAPLWTVFAIVVVVAIFFILRAIAAVNVLLKNIHNSLIDLKLIYCYLNQLIPLLKLSHCVSPKIWFFKAPNW